MTVQSNACTERALLHFSISGMGRGGLQLENVGGGGEGRYMSSDS